MGFGTSKIAHKQILTIHKRHSVVKKLELTEVDSLYRC